MKIKISHLVTLVVLIVLLLDQGLKIWVKTSMLYNQEIYVLGLDWFRLHFTENPGMAFGLELGGSYGKLALSVFRIIAVGFMIYYVKMLISEKAHKGLIISISLILAGAIGNILDSAFYGLIFSESVHSSLATMFPDGGGYASFLHGKVVDMFYFPLYDGYLPEWLPLVGGDRFTFFRPVFNVADSSITIGVLLIIAFQRRFFQEAEPEVFNTGTVAVIEDIDGGLEHLEENTAIEKGE